MTILSVRLLRYSLLRLPFLCLLVRYLKRISGSRKTAGEFLYKLRSYGIIPLGFLILEMLSFYSVEVARPVWGYFLELDPTLAL